MNYHIKKGKLCKILVFVFFVFSLTGCFGKDAIEMESIHTTIYPIEFLTNYLYKGYASVVSIYPDGAKVLDYHLTDKQIETYSKGDVFVYNGLTNENEIAKEFLKQNKNILLIDATYGMKYAYSLEELWLCPNRGLAIAKNIKDQLVEASNSKLIIEDIEKHYREIDEELSFMDADLGSIAKDSKEQERNIIIASSNKLKFLEKRYGFEVISLEDKSMNENMIKSNFKSGKYKDIYLLDSDLKSELINELEKNYGANIINVHTMYTLSAEQVLNNDDYFSIMHAFVDQLRKTCLG